MPNFFKAVLISVLLLCLFAPACWAGEQVILTEELPPYNFLRNNEVYGISTDILLKIMAENNIPVERSSIRLLPWPRAYRMALATPGSILFSTGRTADREKLFKWVGPIIHLNIGLVALKKSNIVVHSLEETAPYTIGTVRDGAPEQLLLGAGVPEARLDRIANPEQNIKKLQAGRIDLFAFSVPSTKYLMKKIGINPREYTSVYTLKRVELYYAFHPDTPDSLIQALNASLKKMHLPGPDGRTEVDRISDQYLNP